MPLHEDAFESFWKIACGCNKLIGVLINILKNTYYKSTIAGYIA